MINFLTAFHNICFCKYDMVQGMSIWNKSYDLHQKHNQYMNVAILKGHVPLKHNIYIDECNVSTSVGIGINIHYMYIHDFFYSQIDNEWSVELNPYSIQTQQTFNHLARILSSSHYGSVNVNIGENTEALWEGLYLEYLI